MNSKEMNPHGNSHVNPRILAFCIACVSLLIVLAVFHAVKADSWAADDISWMKFSQSNFKHIWANPSPFGHYRPLFGTWLHILKTANIDKPMSLGIMGIVLIMISAIVAFKLFRFWLDANAAALAAMLMTIHPAREQNVFWLSAQIDSCCLIFILASLVVAMKFRTEENQNTKYGILISVLTLFACLCKEIALLLPVLVLVLPGRSRFYKRVLATLLSCLGILIYLIPAINVLHGIGRNIILIKSFNLIRLGYYPAILFRPVDISELILRYRVFGEFFPVLLFTIFILIMMLLLAVWGYRFRKKDWALAGIIFILAGALIVCFEPDHRSMGLSCVGISLLVIGTISGRFIKIKKCIFVVILLILISGWIPCWMINSVSWLNAKNYSRVLVKHILEFRKTSKNSDLLVLLGAVYVINSTAYPINGAEIEPRVKNVLVIKVADNSGFVQITKKHSCCYTIGLKGHSRFLSGCKIDASDGIVQVLCRGGKYILSAVFDKSQFIRIHSNKKNPVFLNWNGLKFDGLVNNN